MVEENKAADVQDSLNNELAAEAAPLYMLKTKSYVPSATLVPSELTTFPWKLMIWFIPVAANIGDTEAVPIQNEIVNITKIKKRW